MVTKLSNIIDVSHTWEDADSGKPVNHGTWLIFTGSKYYPSGGINDLVASVCRKGLVLEWLRDNDNLLKEMDWCHIYDTIHQKKYTIPEFKEEFGHY